MPKQKQLTKRRGRPEGKVKGPLQNFRLSIPATKALAKIKTRFGWTKVASVERSLIFAHQHPEFSPETSQAQEVAS